MTYYEILKESKIVYEYLIDILDNSDIQLLDNNQGKIKEFLLSFRIFMKTLIVKLKNTIKMI